ncbi:MAG: ArsR/SmtB family transcription factor [Candidatus Hodarchaeota archaeon]
MTSNRFKNFIDSLKETNCEVFLDRNKALLKELKNNPQFINQLKIHNALSNKKRFLILKLLENQAMCTCALAQIFGTTDGAITHHLKILENAGLIIGKKQGYFTLYYTKELLIEQISR